jgi:alkanesulfonate monooxygenase
VVSTFSVMVEPQEGGTYDDLLALAQKAEALGFNGFFRSDHYHPMNTPLTSDSSDCWSTLAGLARDTKRVRLGTMVSPMTFYHPGQFAKAVATIDQMSGGRVSAGMGAGWFAKEHAAYGLPFPGPGARLDRLEDALEICTRLWSDGVGHSYEGRQFSIKDGPGYPKPIQRPHPPIIMGGGGPKRTPMLAARFADEFNTFGGLNTFNTRKQRVLDACKEIGRDPATLKLSWAGCTVVGTDLDDVRRRAQIRLDFNNEKVDVDEWIANMQKDGWFIGTVDQVAEQVKALQAAGCQHFYFQLVPVNQGDMLEIIAKDLAPKV